MKKGFTLIELLVVVLIIGILVAIAVPQYQHAVAKSQFSSLKSKTKALAEAANIYYLTHNEYPNNFDVLDVSLPIKQSIIDSDINMVLLDNGERCYINKSISIISCFLANEKMRYYFSMENLKELWCVAASDYSAGNKVCQQDTGTTSYNNSNCGDYFSFENPTIIPCNAYTYQN